MTIVFTISVEKSRRRRTADEHNNNPLHVLPTRVAAGQQLRGENRGKKNTTKGGEQGRAVTLEQGDEEGAQQVSTARIADARCGGTAAARREKRKEKQYKGRATEKGGTLEQEDEEGKQVSTARIADARCGRTAAARREQRKEKHYKGRGSEKGGTGRRGGEEELGPVFYPET